MRNSVVFIALVLLPVSFADAQIPTAERNALIALYNSTAGAGWTNSTNWLGAAGTECTWYGVTCVGGYVQKLSLGSKNLSGVIPAELGDLSNLEELSLYNNQLTGSIPSELGSLSNLKKLSLMMNQLSDSIPPELGDLTSLSTGLMLNDNQLTGSIPPELGKLSHLQNLYLYSNQLSGNIPPELGNLVSLLRMHLYDNQLSGSIPPELATPMNMGNLYLNDNQLSGSIPPELGSSHNLWRLDLSNNQLTGSIPPELGSITTLRNLHLSSNRLSGPIPPELGDLSNLEALSLHSNRLSGNIPIELGNLSALLGMNIRFNALHSENATLIAFLNSKQTLGGDWQSTQTIAPENLTVGSLGDHTAWLSWDAVTYQSDPGGYEVFSAPTGTGIWTSGGWTEAKTDTTYPVTGLDPATTYDFGVVSYTDPHISNLNVVNSDFSPEVMATTASGGCAQPIIEIAWGDPNTLSVTGTYDSYNWSTGETTPSIVIDSLSGQWYWVTVTSAGPCEETAATSGYQGTLLLADGFESGDTTRWSNTVP